jgi:hypothetical protein
VGDFNEISILVERQTEAHRFLLSFDDEKTII